MLSNVKKTLQQVEKDLASLDFEKACYIDKNSGKLCFCVTQKKRNSVKPTRKQSAYIRKNGKNLIVTHSHTSPLYSSSLSLSDLEVCVLNGFYSIRAVTTGKNPIVHVLIRPKDGYGDIRKVRAVYKKHDKELTKKYDKLYLDGKITAKQYKNLTIEIMRKTAKDMGWKYLTYPLKK